MNRLHYHSLQENMNSGLKISPFIGKVIAGVSISAALLTGCEGKNERKYTEAEINEIMQRSQREAIKAEEKEAKKISVLNKAGIKEYNKIKEKLSMNYRNYSDRIQTTEASQKEYMKEADWEGARADGQQLVYLENEYKENKEKLDRRLDYLFKNPEFLK